MAKSGKKQKQDKPAKASSKRKTPRKPNALYEAAQPSRMRKMARDQGAPDMQVQQGAVAIRTITRNAEQNHDIVRGVIRTLVNNIVGPNGIGIEPQPRRQDGTIHEEYAAALREAYRDWCLAPDVTQRHHWAKVQRMMCRSWVRDGEVFSQSLIGNVPGLIHGTRVPFSLEMFEADMVPMDYTVLDKGIRQGVQRNTWGRPTGYWVFKSYPTDIGGSLLGSGDKKFISAENVLQLATLDRIGQMRGVSEFASIINRLEDIKDYEESERIAAKVAASLTAYVKKTEQNGYPAAADTSAGFDANGNPNPRELGLAPGVIIDSLTVGEEIGMIDSNRPNPNLVTFRQGQLRAVAAGIGASYSSIARDYNGTYSAQRQELVEQWVNYAVLTDEFVGQFVQPVWKQFVRAAHLSGVVRIPADVKQFSEDDCLFIGQSMPWINPMHEANAWHQLAQDGFASEVEVMRRRGVNPDDVLQQTAAFRAKAKSMGLVFGSDYANEKQTPAAAPKPDVDPEK